MRSMSSKGFTLVEVLVAMAVVAIALPALIAQQYTALDGGQYIRDKTYATWVAQNQLEMLRLEYRLNKTLLKGLATGEVEMMGRTWYWEAKSELQTQSQDIIPGFYKQTVSAGIAQDEMMVSVIGYILDQDAPTPPKIANQNGSPSGN